MGALVHPLIVMTLCACVNAFYSSYIDQPPDAWTADRFKIPPTSPPDVDIRAPHMYVSRASWEGYVKQTGENPYEVEVSKRIYPVPECSEAVDLTVSRDAFVRAKTRVLQYRTIALLLLETSFAHPADTIVDKKNPDLPENYLYGSYKPHHDYLSQNSKDHDYFKKRPTYKLALLAYDQKYCEPEPRFMKVPGTRDKMVPFEEQLLATRWEESKFEGGVFGGSQIPPYKEEFRLCNFTKAFSEYAEAKEFLLNKNSILFVVPPALVELAGNVTETFEFEFRRPHVICIEWAGGDLCEAPPGSPIWYRWNDRNFLAGLTISRPSKYDRNHPETFDPESGEIMRVFVLDLLEHIEEESEPRPKTHLREMIAWIERGFDEIPSTTDDSFQEDDKKLLKIGGNLDPDLVLDMVRILGENKFLPKSGTTSIRGGAGLAIVLTVTNLWKL